MAAREYFVAREYLRVSVDTSGVVRSNDEQHGENQEHAEEQGWQLGRPYEDVGSASRYATAAREGYDELVGDLEAGRFGAQILILWTNSRGSRRVGEWVLLIELCEERGVLIYVTSHGRLYDPANPHDRSNLIDQANKAELFSAELSKAIRRAQRANAKAGKPHGRINVGFRRTYQRDPDNPKKMLVEQHTDKPKAALIHELFDRLDGRGRHARGKAEPLLAIERDWAARGIVNGLGKPYRAAHLRVLAMTHAYAGLRVYTPGRKGRKMTEQSQIIKASWPAIVSEAKFWRVYRMLSDPGRRTSKPGRANHLVSMIALCDPCGGVLAFTERMRGKVKCVQCGARVEMSQKRARGEGACGVCRAPVPAQPAKPGKREYQCHAKGCVRVSEQELDELAEAAVLGFLSDPANVERLTVDEDADERAEQAWAEVHSIERELDELRAALGAGRLTADTAAVVEPEILGRLDTARTRARELSTPSALRSLVTPGEDVELRWKQADMATKRQVMRLLLRPSLVGELRVTRRPEGGAVHVPAKDRVAWVVD